MVVGNVLILIETPRVNHCMAVHCRMKDISSKYLGLLSFNGAAESTKEPVVCVHDAIG